MLRPGGLWGRGSSLGGLTYEGVAWYVWADGYPGLTYWYFWLFGTVGLVNDGLNSTLPFKRSEVDAECRIVLEVEVDVVGEGVVNGVVCFLASMLFLCASATLNLLSILVFSVRKELSSFSKIGLLSYLSSSPKSSEITVVCFVVASFWNWT